MSQKEKFPSPRPKAAPCSPGSARSRSPPLPCQLAFTTWRVNDYDLQIQHNEAVELAYEHLGVTRRRTDPFFDGVRGQMLVKIIDMLGEEFVVTHVPEKELL